MKKMIFVLFGFICMQLNAQIIAGPMIGHVELRTATVWMQLANSTTNIKLSYSRAGLAKAAGTAFISVTGDQFKFAKALLTGLEPGTKYNYTITVNGKQAATGAVTTQQLWQYRYAAPDFSFITGSCTYFNEAIYDRPGKPYGSHDSSIFVDMAKEKSDFMLWLGDNWYTREVDYFSEWGLSYRPTHYRTQPVIQPLLKAMPHYAIWDDHDFGWNDSDKSYPLKETSRKVFMNFWNNPSYGENGQGIYTKLTWNDVDVFMLDDRYFRSNDDMKDSINGQPNPEKKMYGAQQMEWLKNALLQSNNNRNVSFRIIATGSQVLNPLSPFDCFRHFPAEYNELMNFIADNKINGLLFLTGDRHHSEIIKQERSGAYPLYDITASSLSAGISKTYGVEKDNPARIIPEIDEHNFARMRFTGEKQDRKLTVEFIGTGGKKLGEWSVLLKEISTAK